MSLSRRETLGVGGMILTGGLCGTLSVVEFLDSDPKARKVRERYTEEEIINQLSQIETELFQFNPHDAEVITGDEKLWTGVGTAAKIEYETPERSLDDLYRMLTEEERYVNQGARAFEILVENVGTGDPLETIAMEYYGPHDFIYSVKADEIRGRPEDQELQEFYQETVKDELNRLALGDPPESGR